MINVFKSMDLKFYILLLLNILYTKQAFQTFDLIASINNDTLNPLHFEDKSSIKVKRCDYWVPSLFNPILLVHKNCNISGLQFLRESEILFAPITYDLLDINLYSFNEFQNYDLILGKIVYNKMINECYFGLSYSNNTDFNESEINLNKLRKDNKIDKRIFSFDKWSITDNSIKSYLYLGDEHSHFTSKNGIVGTCNSYNEDLNWGCTFNQMKFNNNIIELMNGDKLYKIFFSSESYNITFPDTLKQPFLKLTKDVCYENEETKEINCEGLFGAQEFISIKLINDNMTITTQIDNLYRFSNDTDGKLKNQTRIQFTNDINYIILPLIIFKEFHVQFDLDNNIISFYTTNATLLELKNGNNSENESSNIGIVLLIIFLILLTLALGLGIFWFIKQKRASVEKNINKYNKFEDEDNFQDLKEKRVF